MYYVFWKKVIFRLIRNAQPTENARPVANPGLHEGREWDPSLNRCWEVEEGTDQIVDVQGRLKTCLPFWEKELEPAPCIISYIRELWL